MNVPDTRTGRRQTVLRRVLRVPLVLGIWLAVWVAVLFCWAAAGTRTPSSISPSAGQVGIKFTPASWIAPETCDNCHDRLYSQWRGTMHSFAATDPAYVALYVLADQQSKGRAEELCAASMCHAPVGHLLKEVPPVDGSRLSPIAARGVFCDFCHTVRATRGVGNGRYVVEPGALKRGPYADAVSPFHATAYSKLHTGAQFCATCHNVAHPTNGTKLETTFDEWKRSPYAKRSKPIVCQDCHMGPMAPRIRGPRPGRAALAGPVRPNIYSHDIVGANVIVPSLMGDTSTVRRVRAFLKSAARLSMATGAQVGDSIPVTVRITNVGAGHDLPTGVSEMRQMWVALTLTDRDGRVRYANGILDTLNEVPKGTRVFHTVFGDARGKPTDYIWFATKILKDDRIPPGQSRAVRFLVPVSGVRRPAKIAVRLLYRSMPQYLADVALGKGKLKVPAVEMAKASVTLP